MFAFFDGGTVRVNQDRFLPTQNHISMYGAGIGFNARRRRLRVARQRRVAGRFRAGAGRDQPELPGLDPARQVFLGRVGG